MLVAARIRAAHLRLQVLVRVLVLVVPALAVRWVPVLQASLALRWVALSTAVARARSVVRLVWVAAGGQRRGARAQRVAAVREAQAAHRADLAREAPRPSASSSATSLRGTRLIPAA